MNNKLSLGSISEIPNSWEGPSFFYLKSKIKAMTFLNLPHLKPSSNLALILLIGWVILGTGFNVNAQSKSKIQHQPWTLNESKSVSQGSEAARYPSVITFPSELEKVYGDADYEVGQEFDSYGLPIRYSSEDTTIIRITGNKAMILKAGQTKVFAEYSESYQGIAPALMPQNLIIRQGAVRVTVSQNQHKTFGATDPEFQFQFSGLVYNEGLEVFLGKLTREQGENVGMYPIGLGDLSAGENYELDFVPSNFEITEREIIVEAKDAMKFFGELDPELTFVVDFENPESILSGKLNREPGELVGLYSIELGDLRIAENYKLTFKEAVFEIVPVELGVISEPLVLETAWSIMPELPKKVSALTKNGQLLELNVTWDISHVDLLEKGDYTLSGILEIPDGISNPAFLAPIQKIKVLAKPSPTDLLLSSLVFAPSALGSAVEVGVFSVIDQADDIHSISLADVEDDQSYFRIRDNALIWDNPSKNPIKEVYSITVNVLDRAGNLFQKVFELKTESHELKKIVVHNVFTPNQDGINDRWGVPELSGLGETMLQVFSNNGDLVFEARNPQEQWDGTHLGKNSAAGTYFWVIQVSKSKETRKGFLILLRN